MRDIRFELCDVFTDRPLAGNALSVFTDADGIDGATMQALARETNLSESSFVLSPTTAGANAAIRIFTPTMELPFAGHPTLGTAFVLAARRQQTMISLETGRGVVTVRLSYQAEGGAFGWMTQPLPQIEPYGSAPTLLTALGVTASSLPEAGACSAYPRPRRRAHPVMLVIAALPDGRSGCACAAGCAGSRRGS
jgi:trans-2,3-dihydro-3-hydroxyanthranilate isomerase